MNATEKQYVEKLKEVIRMFKVRKGTSDGGIINTCDIKITQLESEISALEQQISEEESYPREFVEWINWEDDRDDFHFIKDYTMNLWLNADEDMLGYNTDELFDYWQSKVKP